MNNIILIGMPGAGKSTVGIVLAKKLGLKFTDSDLLIQEQKGILLHDIIREHGLDGFRSIENEVNKSIKASKTVIATGGSVVYCTEAMQHLKAIGTIIYLKLPYDEIEKRLGDLEQRGVAIKKGQTLKSLYEERVPLYEKYSDITITCDGKQLREIVNEISCIFLPDC